MTFQLKYHWLLISSKENWSYLLKIWIEFLRKTFKTKNKITKWHVWYNFSNTKQYIIVRNNCLLRIVIQTLIITSWGKFVREYSKKVEYFEILWQIKTSKENICSVILNFYFYTYINHVFLNICILQIILNK